MNKIDGIDLTGKRVLFRKGVMRPEHENLTGIATGGFGCSPKLAGRAVFVRLDNGDEGRVNREDIEAVIE